MASSDKELKKFIEQALTRGASKEDITQVLVEARWSHDRIKSAISAYADIDFVVPVPMSSPYFHARDTFLNCVLFTVLGFSAYYFGSLLFELINIAIPDPTDRTSEASRATSIRWDIAFLFVAFPLYLFLTHKTSSEIAENPAKRASPIRKWLTYIALGIAAFFILGDLVALIFKFLDGALTIRVGLKIMAVAVIASTIFWYYQRSMADDDSAG